MLESTDINIQVINVEPYVFVDTSGTTTYTGISSGFNSGGSSIWKIKKEWKIGNVVYMGYPNGNQNFSFIWNNRTGYNYK